MLSIRYNGVTNKVISHDAYTSQNEVVLRLTEKTDRPAVDVHEVVIPYKDIDLYIEILHVFKNAKKYGVDLDDKLLYKYALPYLEDETAYVLGTLKGSKLVILHRFRCFTPLGYQLEVSLQDLEVWPPLAQ